MNIILAIILALTPTTGVHVDGLDGIVNVTDDYGNIMVVNAACAKVIVDSGVENLEDVHVWLTATPAYIEACF